MSNEKRIQILKDKRDILNGISPSFCAAKWLQTTLYLQNGYNHSCHHPGPHKIPIDEVLDNPAALHNSKFKKEQRRAMLAGQRPAECGYCWTVENLGQEYFSDRHYKSADTWAWDRIPSITSAGADADVSPSYLEVSFSNVCNLKCSYCSSEISSKWLDEINTHGPYPVSQGQHDLTWLKHTGRYPYKHSDDNPYVTAFWKWFPTIINDLDVFRITGGEPLLSKDAWAVLDYVLEHRRAPIVIGINSNLCVEDKLIDKLITTINLLQTHGHIVEVFTSVESTGTKAEYSRYGLNFEQWRNNVEKILTSTTINVHVMTTVNILSITDFTGFIDVLMQLRTKFNHDFAYNRIPTSINILKWPPYLNAANLPPAMKEGLIKQILEHCEQWLKYFRKEKFARLYLEEWDQVKRLCDYILSTPQNERDVNDFRAFIKEYDRRRNVNFDEVFPELKGL